METDIFQIKINLVLIVILFLSLSSCGSSDLCRDNRDYFVKVNKSKPYIVKSKYCLKKFHSNDSLVHVKFRLFDRINNTRSIDKALISINNDSKRFIYKNLDYTIKLKEGKYSIDIVTADNLPLKIKELYVSKNEEVIITGYLGNSLEF